MKKGSIKVIIVAVIILQSASSISAVTYQSSSSVNVESNVNNINGNVDVYKKIEIESNGTKKSVVSTDPGETHLNMENDDTKVDVYQNAQDTSVNQNTIASPEAKNERNPNFMKSEQPDLSYKPISLKEYIINMISSFIRNIF